MAVEHWLVTKNPEPDALGYVLMMKASSQDDWTILPGGAPKSRWAKEALSAAVNQGISIDVTVNPGIPRAVMADPESIEADQDVTLICRENSRDPDRWSLLAMGTSGEFKLLRTVVGIGIERLIEELSTTFDDSPLDRSVFWLRPDWFSTDLLPAVAA